MKINMNEIISWKVVSEFMRRHGNAYKIIETHPCSGQYDCLSVWKSPKNHIMDFNRSGSLHIWSKVDRSSEPNSGVIDHYQQVWHDYTADPKQTLNKICKMAGLPTATTMPISSPAILTYRFISTFLIQTVLGLDKWECRNGFLDSSGYSSGIVEDFKNFPQAEKRLRVREKDDLIEQPAYRFWFLKKNGIPKICLETNGLAWTDDGEEYSLPEIYKAKRKMLSLVSNVGGQYLP